MHELLRSLGGRAPVGAVVALLGLSGCFDPPGLDQVVPTTTGEDGPVAEDEGAPTSAGSTQTSDEDGSAGSEATTDATATSDDETSGSADTGDTETTDASTSGGDVACDDGGVCLPDPPLEWSGPVVLVESGDPSCPPGAPQLLETVYRGLVEGVHVCSCACNVGTVACDLVSGNTGDVFVPSGSCDSPPTNDDCLSAVVDVSCAPSVVDQPAEPSWQFAAAVCGGGVEAASCAGGGCYAAQTGAVCIHRDGDHACPAGYPARQLYERGYDDGRSCTSCDCSPSGQSCSIDIEVCSLAFEDVVLTSGGTCHQLNSSDGDGVTLLSSSVGAVGSCSAPPGSGQVQGGIVPTGTVTFCCAP